MLEKLREKFTRDGGAVSVEYIVILVLIGLAVIAGATVLGRAINDELSEASTRVDTTLIP
jgi:Flp pilus assembly pilin Flp